MTNKEYQDQMKEHEKRMEEIDKAHFDKLSAEWEVQKPVTFSMKELVFLRKATLDSIGMYYKVFREEDPDMRAVMHKVDKLIEDMEIEIRDRE